MQDISKEADFYLTKKAREALKKKALTTVFPRNDSGWALEMFEKYKKAVSDETI